MRIVMMGTGPFAVPTLEALIASDHEVVCLFTQPLRPTRGKRPAPPTPMRDVAQQHGLPIYDPESINTDEAREILRQQAADLLVVCDYGQILSRESLAEAKLGGINLHGSILPKYRGAAPVNWAIYNGDPETGITVIHMTPKLDGGPCLKVVRTPIGPTETAVELEPRLALLGVPAVLESIAMLEASDGETLVGEPQDPSLVSKAPRLKKTDADIDWTKSAQQIYNQFRAFQPWPGCYTHWSREGKPPLRLILAEISLEPEPAAAEPGTIISATGDQLRIAAEGGQIVVQKLQPAGKKIMEAAEFIRGYQPAAGERFVAESLL
ncbi:methionyl-tRNA formyltransferase [Blastopirellula marina]|uniref:Methionyl-tRNA formyltransferase n=1 Tax=Blastopirellula marina TaxID=124 RepID=A0A2S8FLK1_9BACT|nr:methionyl-tRNA formyltransferase [Blastopirellula marina]PQO33043.1 methionyl-tRNA formyltransferase [Blastopirellula marina]PTL43210.1 methionyl-tRNA formyltransferase [Blastopirellula marina]